MLHSTPRFYDSPPPTPTHGSFSHLMTRDAYDPGFYRPPLHHLSKAPMLTLLFSVPSLPVFRTSRAVSKVFYILTGRRPASCILSCLGWDLKHKPSHWHHSAYPPLPPGRLCWHGPTARLAGRESAQTGLIRGSWAPDNVKKLSQMFLEKIFTWQCPAPHFFLITNLSLPLNMLELRSGLHSSA